MLLSVAILFAGATVIYLGVLLIRGPTEVAVGFGLVLVAIGLVRILRAVTRRPAV